MKRFTDTDIWDKEWFMQLSCKHKCLVRFIFDKCDSAGVWQPNFKLATAYVGEQITIEDINQLSCQLEILKDGKIFIPDFVSFQYGKLSESCKPHLKIIFLLKKHKLFERVCIGYTKGMNTLEETEKETEEEEEEVKGKRKGRAKNPEVLFEETEYVDFSLFEKQYEGSDYEHYNLKFYHESVMAWSKQGNKKKDWIATARNFMLNDFKEGKAVLKNGNKQTAKSGDDRNDLQSVYKSFAQSGGTPNRG